MTVDYSLLEKAVISACESVIAAESEITHYDIIAGDGDCGLTLKSGATGRQHFYRDGIGYSDSDNSHHIYGRNYERHLVWEYRQIRFGFCRFGHRNTD